MGGSIGRIGLGLATGGLSEAGGLRPLAEAGLGNTGSTFRKGSAESGQAGAIARDIAARGGQLREVYWPQLLQYAGAGQLPLPFEQMLGQGAQELGQQGSKIGRAHV